MKKLIVLLIILPLNSFAISNCSNAGISTIMNFCLDSVFPIRVMGKDIIKGNDIPAPQRATHKKICSCKKKHGIPILGITTGRWVPTRMIEITRKAGCSPVYGDILNPILQSLITNKNVAGEGMGYYQTGLRHYNNWVFPLSYVFGVSKCFRKGPDLETSITNFNWVSSDRVWMNILYPEWIGIASKQNSTLMDYTAHATSCVANTLGKGTNADDLTYWLGGCLDNNLPATGFFSGAKNSVTATSTILNRAIFASARTGGFASYSTCGDKALCGAKKVTFPAKSEFKVTMLFPYSENNTINSTNSEFNIKNSLRGEVADFLSINSNCAHRLGSSNFRWGLGRSDQATNTDDSDAVYLIWRWVDCCEF